MIHHSSSNRKCIESRLTRVHKYTHFINTARHSRISIPAVRSVEDGRKRLESMVSVVSKRMRREGDTIPICSRTHRSNGVSTMTPMLDSDEDKP